MASNKEDRLSVLDTARGLAIALMVLSHTVKGLLPFKLIPDWGISPVHLITKFSSSLFILVFGVSVAVAYLPKVGTDAWPEVRRKLWIRGAVILLWYKILTVVQMFERYDTEVIVDTLLFLRFTDFAEILQFYAWLVLLLPFLLPAWKRLALWPQLAVAYGVGLLGYTLKSWDFFDVWQLKAIFVEQKGTFCFGLLTRGPLVLFAMALGGTLIATGKERAQRMRVLSTAMLVLGCAAMGFFVVEYWKSLEKVTVALAKNYGKHPPRLIFMSFSVGGALILFGLLAKLEPHLNRAGWALRTLGRQSLFCFNAHLLVLFLGYRWTLGLRHEVSYGGALALTALNAGVCCAGALGWERMKVAVKEWRRARRRAEDQDVDAAAAEEEWNESATEVVVVPRAVASHRRR